MTFAKNPRTRNKWDLMYGLFLLMKNHSCITSVSYANLSNLGLCITKYLQNFISDTINSVCGKIEQI